MNKHALSDFDTEYQEQYERDGVVLVKQAFDPYWVEFLLEAWDKLTHLDDDALYKLPDAFLEIDPRLRAEMALNRGQNAEDRKRYTEFAKGFRRSKYMRWWVKDFETYVMESNAAEVIGRVIGSKKVRFFTDAIFMKEPMCEARTYWHTDGPSWPVDGAHVPTMWMPLHPVFADMSSLEYIVGSHKMDFGAEPWPETFNSDRLEHPADRPRYYDWESRRGDPGVQILSYDMEPGDAVIIHPKTYHGGGANLHPSLPRIAISTRWLGDDARWAPRPESVNIPGMPLEQMEAGAPVTQDDIFPVVWEATR